MKMKTKATVHRMVTVLLAIAVSPLCLSAANYYTKASGRKDVYAVGGFWADVEGTVSPDAPSPGNDYYVVTNVNFNTDGVFCGDSLSLGLPSDHPDGTAPAWAISGPGIFPYGANGTYTINDLRLYSGKIYARSDNKYDFTIAGTATVYSVSQGVVELKAYRNANDDNMKRRSINLASTLKGESSTILTLNPYMKDDPDWLWPTVPAYLVLSGDFSEYHGRFYARAGLILLNTTTAFGCEADGAKEDVYFIYDNATMAVAADKSTSMSRTRGVTIYRTKTLTLTTTNIVDEALSYRGDYSGYTVTFPISGETSTTARQASTTLVKSGEGTVTLDCDCNVGTVRVAVATLALGPNFVSSTYTPNLVLAAGTQIAPADGVCAEFSSVTVEGVAVGHGIYTGTGGPAYATPVAWISGTGTLYVRPAAAPATRVADTWKAEGNAGLMSASTSWVGESAPDLTTGEFLPTFANAGSGAVADAYGFLRGIEFNATGNFALTGEKALMLYDAGITAADAESAREYTVSTPLFAEVSQTWNVGENVTVAIEGAFGGMRTAAVTKTGSGTLDISGTNDYPGALSVSGGRLRLSGVFGSFAETDGALSVANNVGAGMTLAGVTINKPVTQRMKNSSGDLTAEAGTTNVFNGRVAYSRGGSMGFPLGDGVVIAYNDGLTIDLGSSTTRNFTFSKDGTVATPPLVRFCGSPSVVSRYDVITFKSEVACRFEVPGNAIMKYQSTGSGKLEATVDYAWNGTDGIGVLDIYGAGGVIDVGSTRQCIQDVTVYNNNDKYYAIVAGNGGTLELAPTEDQTVALNQLRFEGMVSLQKHGAATLTLTNKTASAYSQCYGDVAVTNGVLEFAAGATWLNGTNVTVSGSGTLKLNAANTFNREHAVIRFADSGVINVPPGVTQVFAEGWDGDRRLRGTYKTGSSSCVTGGGAIRVGDTGFRMLIR